MTRVLTIGFIALSVWLVADVDMPAILAFPVVVTGVALICRVGTARGK